MNCLILDIVFISKGSLSQYEYAEKIGDLVNIVDKALGSTMPLRVSRAKVNQLYLVRCSGTMLSLIRWTRTHDCLCDRIDMRLVEAKLYRSVEGKREGLRKIIFNTR